MPSPDFGDLDAARFHGGEQGTATVHVVLDRAFEWKVDKRFIKEAAGAVLDQEGPFDQVELTVRVTGDDELRRLNHQYRGIDAPTDVLSFPAGAPIESDARRDHIDEAHEDGFALPADIFDQLGDLVVSYPRAVAQAHEYGHDVKRELGWLVVHGVLQLLGYSHDSSAEANVMRAREELALESLGLPKS